MPTNMYLSMEVFCSARGTTCNLLLAALAVVPYCCSQGETCSAEVKYAMSNDDALPIHLQQLTRTGALPTVGLVLLH